MGFCFYNNVVVAAYAALQEPGVCGGLEYRVLYF